MDINVVWFIIINLICKIIYQAFNNTIIVFLIYEKPSKSALGGFYHFTYSGRELLTPHDTPSQDLLRSYGLGETSLHVPFKNYMKYLP